MQCVGHLGSGQFGSVEQATWKWGRLKVNVALKSLNSQALSDLDRVKFLQEAVLMAQFKHPNIISLYGVVCLGEPVSHVIHHITTWGRHVMSCDRWSSESCDTLLTVIRTAL